MHRIDLTLLIACKMLSVWKHLQARFLAMMLGASRPTVTIVAGTLQKAGLITYHRGRLTILDRKRLEAASCECYRNVTDLLKNVRVGPQ